MRPGTSGFPIGGYIGLESKIAKSKGAYYDVLKASGQNWTKDSDDPILFIEYFLGTILSIYKNLGERLSIVSDNKTSIEQVRAAIRGIVGKFTKRQIMELVPDVGKSSVESALKTLVDEGFILWLQGGQLFMPDLIMIFSYMQQTCRSKLIVVWAITFAKKTVLYRTHQLSVKTWHDEWGME